MGGIPGGLTAIGSCSSSAAVCSLPREVIATGVGTAGAFSRGGSATGTAGGLGANASRRAAAEEVGALGAPPTFGAGCGARSAPPAGGPTTGATGGSGMTLSGAAAARGSRHRLFTPSWSRKTSSGPMRVSRHKTGGSPNCVGLQWVRNQCMPLAMRATLEMICATSMAVAISRSKCHRSLLWSFWKDPVQSREGTPITAIKPVHAARCSSHA
jgi:hypothetical protein